MLRGPRQAIKRVEQSTFRENRDLLIEYDVTMGCLTKRRDGSPVARLPVGREFQHTRHADSGVSRPQSFFSPEQIEPRYTSPLAGMRHRENWHGAKPGGETYKSCTDNRAKLFLESRNDFFSRQYGNPEPILALALLLAEQPSSQNFRRLAHEWSLATELAAACAAQRARADPLKGASNPRT